MLKDIFWLPTLEELSKLVPTFEFICKLRGHKFEQIGSENETENWVRGPQKEKFQRETVLRLYRCMRCGEKKITRKYIDDNTIIVVDYDYLYNKRESYKALFNEVSK